MCMHASATSHGLYVNMIDSSDMSYIYMHCSTISVVFIASCIGQTVCSLPKPVYYSNEHMRGQEVHECGPWYKNMTGNPPIHIPYYKGYAHCSHLLCSGSRQQGIE